MIHDLHLCVPTNGCMISFLSQFDQRISDAATAERKKAKNALSLSLAELFASLFRRYGVLFDSNSKQKPSRVLSIGSSLVRAHCFLSVFGVFAYLISLRTAIESDTHTHTDGSGFFFPLHFTHVSASAAAVFDKHFLCSISLAKTNLARRATLIHGFALEYESASRLFFALIHAVND